MTHQLSDAEWEDLVDLIIEAPLERLQLALRRIDTSSASATALRVGADRLLHVATISSGNAFDRALLRELRRLNAH